MVTEAVGTGAVVAGANAFLKFAPIDPGASTAIFAAGIAAYIGLKVQEEYR
jgi:hypothetical protein